MARDMSMGSANYQQAGKPSVQSTKQRELLHIQVMKLRYEEELLVKAGLVGEATRAKPVGYQEPVIYGVLHKPSPLGLNAPLKLSS